MRDLKTSFNKVVFKLSHNSHLRTLSKRSTFALAFEQERFLNESGCFIL